MGPVAQANNARADFTSGTDEGWVQLHMLITHE